MIVIIVILNMCYMTVSQIGNRKKAVLESFGIHLFWKELVVHQVQLLKLHYR